jgi:hypothetical protein
MGIAVVAAVARTRSINSKPSILGIFRSVMTAESFVLDASPGLVAACGPQNPYIRQFEQCSFERFGGAVGIVHDEYSRFHKPYPILPSSSNALSKNL